MTKNKKLKEKMVLNEVLFLVAWTLLFLEITEKGLSGHIAWGLILIFLLLIKPLFEIFKFEFDSVEKVKGGKK